MKITDSIKEFFKLRRIKKGGYSDIETIMQLNDASKIKCIDDNYFGEELTLEIIKTMTDDRSKESCLDYVVRESSKVEIIKSMTDDKSKGSCLDKVSSETSKIEIIKSMTDDKSKGSCLDKVSSETSKIEIIKSMTDEAKEKYLDKISGISKGEIVESMTTDEAKKRCLGAVYPSDKTKIIKSMLSDKIKKECLSELSERGKLEIIESMTNDETKMECLDMFDNESIQCDIIKSMTTDEVKERCLEIVDEKFLKMSIIQSMTADEIKERYLDIFNEDSKIEIIKSMTDEAKEKYLDKISCISKGEIVESMTTDEAKEQCLDMFEKEFDKFKIIKSMKTDLKKIQNVINLPLFFQTEFYDELNYENFFEIYKSMNPKCQTLYRNLLKEEYIETIRKNLDFCIASETDDIDIEQTREYLAKMEESNEEVLKNINFNILKPQYIETLGIDKINTISCSREIQEEILNLTKEEYNVFFSCLNHYMRQEETEQWTDMTALLLNNISGYKELINDLQGKDYDINKLYELLQNPNNFKIDSARKLKEIDEIIKQKCEEYIHSENIERKREAVLQKIFGQSTKEIEILIKQYGEDIDTIENEDLKDYIKSVQTIMKAKPKTLERIFEKIDEQEKVHKLAIQRKLKKEFAKQYNKGLLRVNSENSKGKIITIPSPNSPKNNEFKIILTSIAAFVDKEENVGLNEKENWNRKNLSSPHFCTSYVRNDMLGTAPIGRLCYGFNEMHEDSLVLSGHQDIASNHKGLFSKSSSSIYYSPDKQINKTESYNEMDFLRFQNGKKKQPDYLIVFKTNGDLQRMEEAQKASKEWGEMPIVVIDVDEVLRQERLKVEELQKNYEENSSLENARSLYYKVRNNRVTVLAHSINLSKVFEGTSFEEEQEFGENIDLEKLKNQIEPQLQVEEQNMSLMQKSEIHQTGELQIEDYEGAYSKVSAMDRRTEVSKIHRISEKVKEIQKTDIEERD